MPKRREVGDAPHGSPVAGPVRVSKVPDGWVPYTNPWLAVVSFVREEDPLDSDLEPGTTITGGPGASWARKVAPYRDEEDEA